MKLHRFAAVGAWMTLALVGLATVTTSTPVFADDYSAQWGPALGKKLPMLEAYDQDGQLRTLENLAGERGLLLYLNRSADW